MCPQRLEGWGKNEFYFRLLYPRMVDSSIAFTNLPSVRSHEQQIAKLWSRGAFVFQLLGRHLGIFIPIIQPMRINHYGFFFFRDLHKFLGLQPNRWSKIALIAAISSKSIHFAFSWGSGALVIAWLASWSFKRFNVSKLLSLSFTKELLGHSRLWFYSINSIV